jgi:NADH dehydrogenase
VSGGARNGAAGVSAESGAKPGAKSRAPHRIVVVGGGAGGLELVTLLGDRLARRDPGVQVVLVDRSATHIWKPLLHEVAAGSMDPHTHQLAYAAQANWHHFEFQQGELLGLDRKERTIRVGAVLDEDGTEVLPERAIAYDTLVLAVGSITNFFGVPGTAEHALALDTAEQADRFRRRLISACMRAQGRSASAPRASQTAETPAGAAQATARATVSVAIVGAGATGVELSAELRNTAQVLSVYGLHDLDPRHDIRIHLIEAGPRVLPALPTRVSEGIVDLLGKLDVDVLTGERVVEVTGDCVRTASGKTIPSDLTVWAAGIVAPPVLSALDGLAVNRTGQILVRQSLQTETDPDIFAMGDCAACPWLATGGSVPPRAQSAHQQAKFLSHSLVRRVRGGALGEFHFRDFGSLVSLGHFSAMGNLMGGLIGGNLLIEGLVARMMYTSLYRMHVLALHGFWRMLLDTFGHWLRSKTTPRVKLH